MTVTSLAALAAITVAVGADHSAAYVTPTQAANAAERGANWFRAEQDDSGALAGDWGMTALAAAGTNAADVRNAVANPSAQDFYLDDWTANGPGGVATDAERGVLTGWAGGVQPSRVSVERNFVATIASQWDGTQIGSTGLLNDDIFGALALARVGAPVPLRERIGEHIRTKQLADGGWSWSNSPSATADTDMTGSAVAALCATGADPSADADLQEAFAYLHTVQDAATGGFSAPPWTPVNTDTTGWVASGLIQCGIDPQSAEWTTAQGKTALDFLLSMQKPDGRFCWNDPVSCQGSAAFATWDAVRPLGGEAFSARPPQREDEVTPAVRPAPAVADGTEVPITLVIDYGAGAGVDMCSAEVSSGDDLDAVLTSAEATAVPAGCVTEHSIASGITGGEVLEQLNGVSPDGASEWRVSVDGSAEASQTTEPIGFGDLLFVRLAGKATEPVDPPVLDPGPYEEPKLPRVEFGRSKRVRLDGKQIAPKVICPPGLGADGCRGTVAIEYRKRAELRSGGLAPFAISSGVAERIAIRVRTPLRREVARRGFKGITLIAATRSAEGAVTETEADRKLAARAAREER